jgi:transcriptional regulator with GAF, ATPase, and Fis domain
VVGAVSVGFLERQVNAGAWSELPSAAAAAGFALLLGVAASLLLARRLKRITFGLELDEIARHLRKAEQLAAEQASLRRVATLVAVGTPQEDLFAAVAEEVGRLADADTAQVYRYQQDDSIVRVAAWGHGREDLALGATYRTGGRNVSTLVRETGRPARIDDTATLTGEPASIAAQLNLHSVVGSPIAVDGHLWGLIMVSTSRPEPMAEDAEQRIAASPSWPPLRSPTLRPTRTWPLPGCV